MPMITIKYDDKKVKDENIVELGKVVQRIVIEATGIKEVFVYADSPKIKIDVAPIEVFIEMTGRIIEDKTLLLQEIKSKLSEWKKENNFEYPITLTLTPMDWIFEVDI